MALFLNLGKKFSLGLTKNSGFDWYLAAGITQEFHCEQLWRVLPPPAEAKGIMNV